MKILLTGDISETNFPYGLRCKGILYNGIYITDTICSKTYYENRYVLRSLNSRRVYLLKITIEQHIMYPHDKR
jgi:hypothetical protein